jgi:thiamine biosynthesis lipoprotein
VATLVNLGGDIAAAGGRDWEVGIEDPSVGSGRVARTVRLRQGGIATSGATKRFVIVDGERLAHIVDPRTGWPVRRPPMAVTVKAATCTEAGFWSTLAMLQGEGAESFLAGQGLPYWCLRPS